jgi:hypothetical protein
MRRDFMEALMMRIFPIAAGFAAFLALSACVSQSPVGVPPPVPGEEDQCGAVARQGLIGQSREVLAEKSFTGPVRVIGPNQAVTMDFNPERINLETDSVGIITRVFCG